jgi:ribosomal protein S18 acetylase RimI-like enzyme
MNLPIRAYGDDDLTSVAALWARCGMLRDGTDPAIHIAQCRDSGRGVVFVADDPDGAVMATVMAGHDGVQGWLHYVAVDPTHRRRHLGRRLVRQAEGWLRRKGMKRVCLLVRDGEEEAAAFYERLGYRREPRYPNQARLKGGELLMREIDGR